MERIHKSPRVNQERKYQVRNLSDKSVSYHKNPSVSINELLDIFFEKKLFKRFTPRQTFRVLNKNKHYDFTNLKYAAKCIRYNEIRSTTTHVSANSAEYRDISILDEPRDNF